MKATKCGCGGALVLQLGADRVTSPILVCMSCGRHHTRNGRRVCERCHGTGTVRGVVSRKRYACVRCGGSGATLRRWMRDD